MATAKKKPAAEAAAAEPVTAETVAPKRRKKASKAAPPVSAEQRFHYVEVAAYYIAQERGFAAGDPAADWAAAEAEIDRLLAEGLINA